MLIVPVKEGENIEKALKKFKKKSEKTKVIREYRNRQFYTKPSEERRAEKLKAIYKNKLQQKEEES